jgi:DNA polymerase-3 subunit beta
MEQMDLVLGEPVAATLHETMKITIDAALLKGLLAFAGRQDIRYYLNSILLETTETSAIVVGTDGNTLAVHRVSADDVEGHRPGLQVIIPRAALESVKPRRSGRTQTVSIELGTEVITVVGETTASAAPVDAKYPDWRRVLPATVSGEPGQVNPRFFARVGLLADAVLGKGTSPVMFFNTPGPLLIQFDENTLAAVMPLRDKPVFTGLPTWVNGGQP